MTDSRNKYYAPTLRSVVLGVGVLCASLEPYTSPKGIIIADYNDVLEADDNDW